MLELHVITKPHLYTVLSDDEENLATHAAEQYPFRVVL